jgi:hypothetical protein
MTRSCCLGLLLAWTLWTRTTTPTNDSWSAVPNLGSQARCEASMKDKLETWKQFKDAKFEKTNSVTFTTNNTTMSYLCLPDAEDPRKPEKPAKPTKPAKQSKEPGA